MAHISGIYIYRSVWHVWHIFQVFTGAYEADGGRKDHGNGSSVQI